MSRILVYFRDGQKAGFDKDKAIFQDDDGTVFSASNADLTDEKYAALIESGRALINWANVNFVREIEPLPDAPGDGGETE